MQSEATCFASLRELGDGGMMGSHDNDRDLSSCDLSISLYYKLELPGKGQGNPLEEQPH
jgi:hypothetical protein